ncbi:MAG: hypothetical protein KC619_31540 [Myxococcales bacterium]|nr:hypothetical protein [Myxococcales bacterium]
MTRLLIGLSILAAAVAARAETVTVISPLGDGPATADAVAELRRELAELKAALRAPPPDDDEPPDDDAPPDDAP